jgi:hypothetical protein
MCVVPIFLHAASRFSVRLRNQSAERNLKRQRFDINVIIAADRRMQINPVKSDADRIVKFFRVNLIRAQAAETCCSQNGKFGFDAPRFAHIRHFRQTVSRSGYVGAIFKPGKPASVCSQYKNDKLKLFRFVNQSLFFFVIEAFDKSSRK